MAKIGLIAVDSKHPNLALMKIARYHKAQGDEVDWYNAMDGRYDIVYMSKIFTFTPDYEYYVNADQVEKGGTGYDIHKNLPDTIDRLQPDYSMYPEIDKRTAYGFLTRGCPNHCGWCVVPKKEGMIRPYMDIEEIAIEGRNKIVLYDNNVLASDYGLGQIEKIAKLGLAIDFNQAIDARLVTDEVAQMLARVKWKDRCIRFGCDTPKQVSECDRASELILRHGFTGYFHVQCMLYGSFEECFERVNHWRQKDIQKYSPYAQPFRRLDGKPENIPQWQKDMARWCNRRELYKLVDFKDYAPRKGFTCKEYFNEKI